MRVKCLVSVFLLSAIAFLVLGTATSPVRAQEPGKNPKYISPRVFPHRVTIDPQTVKPEKPPKAKRVPEGEPLPSEKPPKRKPVKDPVIQIKELGVEIDAAAESIGLISDPDQNFAGISANANPPDTVGDVGPEHYVQMVNATQFQVWDKQGNSLLGPTTFGNLWPAGDPCRSDNWGDPVVVYDHLADRWLLSQFDMASLSGNTPIAPFFMCIAISQTPDPSANSWYLYSFETDEFPDYPKFGVWPDGYYMSSNESKLGIYVFDRANMLLGNAAFYMRTEIAKESESGVRATRILPSDLDGPAPPMGTPNYFVHTVDDQQDSGGSDRIEVYEFDVNWIAPSFTFTLANTLSPAPFQIMLCDRTGNGSRDCIPQPDTAYTIDALSNRPMMQLKYRDFGSHEAMVFNQTIDVSGSIEPLLGFVPDGEVAGIRWYELRKSGANWSIYQEGTYAAQPTGADEAGLLHRWMGSAAIDGAGNIALGYSISNDDDDNEVFPGIRYTGRKAGDLLNQMTQGEKVILNGTNSQTGGFRRWGDYSALTVDPVDNCTFWYTTHVAGVGGTNPKPTQIASFRFDTCGTDLEISKVADPDPAVAGGSLTYTITVLNGGPLDTTNVTVIDTLPVGVNFATSTVPCVEAPAGVLTCDLGSIDAGDSVTFDIMATIDSNLTAIAGGPTTITNSAVVSADQPELDESNNTVVLTTIVEELADLAVAKLCKPDQPLQAEETGTCTIFVDNEGPSDARDVVLTDTIVSDGLFTIGMVTSTQGSCNVIGNVVTCDLGVLPAGDRATITVEVTSDDGADINDLAEVDSATPDPDITNNSDQGQFIGIPLADLEITKSDTPDPVVAGTPLDYTLIVTNHGPSEAVNVLVKDIVPAGVSIVSVTSSAGTCNAGVPGDPLQPTTCGIDSLSAGGSETITITVDILPQTLGLLHNDAQVSSDTLDENNSNDYVTEDTTVIAEADLVVTKADHPDPVLAGTKLTYEVTVINNGPSTAIDVELEDALPSDVHFLGATISGGTGTCVLLDMPPNTLDCKLNDLNPGGSVTIFIDVIVFPSVPDGTDIMNTATVSSATPDPNPGDNSITEPTLVLAEADVYVEKTSDKDTYSPSDVIVYTVTVTNGGPSDAQDIVIVDNLPLNPKKLTYVFSTAGVYDFGSHTVTCDVGTLASGESFSFDIHVTTKGSAGVIINKASVYTSTDDPDPSNNTVAKDVDVEGGDKGPGGGGKPPKEPKPDKPPKP